MSLNARKVKSNSGPKAPAMDAGAYPCRLVQVIDLGVQPQEFGGEKKAPKREIMVTYEFTDEFMPNADGEPDESKPRWLSERFPLNNLDSDLAKSTKRYYSLDPNEEHDGEWPELIGSPVLVTVTRKARDDGDRNYVGGTAAVRSKDAAKYPDLVNDPRVFLMDEPDLEVFEALPEWVRDLITSSLEFEGSALDIALNNKGGKKETKKSSTKKEEPKKKTEEVVEEDSIPFEADTTETDSGDDW